MVGGRWGGRTVAVGAELTGIPRRGGGGTTPPSSAGLPPPILCEGDGAVAPSLIPDVRCTGSRRRRAEPHQHGRRPVCCCRHSEASSRHRRRGGPAPPPRSRWFRHNRCRAPTGTTAVTHSPYLLPLVQNSCPKAAGDIRLRMPGFNGGVPCAVHALCARCAKSWLFSTTGSSVSSED